MHKSQGLVYWLRLISYSLIKPKKEITATEKQKQLIKNDAESDGNKAKLTLANGEQIILESAANCTPAQQVNAKVINPANGGWSITQPVIYK